MSFTPGKRKTGGRKAGQRNKRTLAAEPKIYPDALEHLAKIVATDDGTITPELKVRAAIGLAAYQHPKPAPLPVETFIGPIDYTAPTTPEEARAALLALGERLARGEISVEAHDALVNGIRAYLGDKAAEQERRLSELEDAMRQGDALQPGSPTTQRSAAHHTRRLPRAPAPALEKAGGSPAREGIN